MHAWIGHGFGAPDTLRFEEVPERALDQGEARLALRACGINFADALLVAGQYQVKPEPPFIPGFEVAGEVIESREPALPVGARVVSTLDGSGGYATRAIARKSSTYLLPDELPYDTAAALTVTYQTAW